MNVALASVVTLPILDEFLVLKESFELFHGGNHAWYVNCDRGSGEILSRLPNVLIGSFSNTDLLNRYEVGSPDFRYIMEQKMNAIEFAWSSPSTTAVMYLDADIIVTANLIDYLSQEQSSVILTPNYYPLGMEHLAAIHGYFNAGFAFTRVYRFHQWWRQASLNSTSAYADQVVLNHLLVDKSVSTLAANANVGFWRSRPGKPYDQIPADCQFIHVHLFQPLRTTRHWLDKRYAIHALKFLRESSVKQHQAIFQTILRKDESRWYQASLQLV